MATGMPWIGAVGLRQSQCCAITRRLTRGGGNPVARRFSSTSSSFPGAVTLLTPDPSRVTPQTLVSRLPSLPYTPETKDVAPVFLISSALAPWLCDLPSLSQRLVGHVFGRLNRESGLTGPVDVDAVFAVVDKVPFRMTAYLDNQAASTNSTVQDLERKGCDGLSMLLFRRDALFGSIAPASYRRDASTPEPESTFFYETTTPLPDVDRSISERVSIPVANTVFTTGEPRTLQATRWRITPEAQDPSLQAIHNLGRCRVTNTSKESTSHPFIPMDAITKPRRVVTSMGNVVSKFSREDGKQIPPSSELEKTLPEYVERHNLGHQKLAVWALVTQGVPEETTPDSGPSTPDLSELLKKGARLHRVMGGGGGWGKKQGLLSLDPDDGAQQDSSSPPERPIRDILGNKPEEEVFPASLDELPSFLQSTDKGFSTAMASVAQPGDTMQFFVASLEKPGISALKSSHPACSNSRVFGVIPATDIPAPSEERTEQTPSATEDDVIVVPNLFGALSEKSVSWTSLEHSGLENASRESSGTGHRISGTKIDVPGSRVIMK